MQITKDSVITRKMAKDAIRTAQNSVGGFWKFTFLRMTGYGKKSVGRIFSEVDFIKQYLPIGYKLSDFYVNNSGVVCGEIINRGLPESLALGALLTYTPDEQLLWVFVDQIPYVHWVDVFSNKLVTDEMITAAYRKNPQYFRQLGLHRHASTSDTIKFMMAAEE